METVKDRLIKFIAYLKIGQGKFEKQCNLSNGFVSNIKDGFSTPNLSKIAIACPDLNLDWLLTGEGSMLKPDQSPTVSHSGNSASYTGNFHDVNTRIGSGTSIQGYGNAVGTGNSIGDISGSDNNVVAEPGTSYIQRKKAQKLGTPIPEVMELRHENEKLKAEIEHLKSTIELQKSFIEEKERMITILLEKK